MSSKHLIAACAIVACSAATIGVTAVNADVQSGDNGDIALWVDTDGGCRSLARFGDDVSFPVSCLVFEPVGGRSSSVGHVSWSPDGTEILFTLGEADGSLWRVPSDGSGEPEEVLINGTDSIGCAWNHDWATDDIVWFHSNCEDVFSLNRLDLSTGAVTTFVNDCSLTPNVSPDGLYIVATDAYNGSEPPTHVCVYEVVDDAANLTLLHELELSDASAMHTSWTTDGTVMFVQQGFGVLEWDPEQAEPTVLFQDQSVKFPMMSPDGEKVSYFKSNKLYIADADFTNEVAQFVEGAANWTGGAAKWQTITPPPPPSTTIAPTTIAPTTTPTTVPSTSVVDTLPATGSDSQVAVIAALLLVAGGALTAMARRRRAI